MHLIHEAHGGYTIHLDGRFPIDQAVMRVADRARRVRDIIGVFLVGLAVSTVAFIPGIPLIVILPLNVAVGWLGGRSVRQWAVWAEAEAIRRELIRRGIFARNLHVEKRAKAP